MTSTIELEGVTQRFGDVTAVDDLSTTFAQGRIHGLLGRNGSGKTTLLSIVAGFRRATSGRALLDGQPVFENAGATTRIALIRGAGDVVEQDWPDDRVENALAFAGRLRPHWDPDYADELVERFELDPRIRIGELSRGRRAALGVVLGLAARAPVTIFDETHLGMDAPSRYAFYDELLRDFMEHPRTVVVSTHLIEEFSAMFEQVTIVDRGRLVLAEEAETLRARGVAVTGPGEAVDRFVADRRVLARKQLGRTKSATVYGSLDEAERRDAAAAGLDVAGIPLQDLFVHLTDPTGGHR